MTRQRCEMRYSMIALAKLCTDRKVHQPTTHHSGAFIILPSLTPHTFD